MRNSLHLRFTFLSFDAQLNKTMNVEGSQPAAFCRLLGVVTTAAPGNRQNAGGAGPGLITYLQPTVSFNVCFALAGALCGGGGGGW